MTQTRTVLVVGLRNKTTQVAIQDADGPILRECPIGFVAGPSMPSFTDVVNNWPRSSVDPATLGNDCGVPWEKSPIQTTQPQPVFSFQVHYEEIDDIVVLPPVYKGSVDFNNCAGIGGWAADAAHADTPQVVSIYCDGVLVGKTTAKITRPDVKDELIRQGYTVTSTTFGWSFDKPAIYWDGQNHTWTACFGDSAVEFGTYNQAQAITCAAPIDPNGVKGWVGDAINVVEGGSLVEAKVREQLNSGAERVRTDQTLYSWKTTALNGSHLSPNGTLTSVFVSLDSDTISANITQTLLAKTSSGQLLCEIPVNFINQGCTRPAGLTTAQLSYHFIAASTGAVTGYGTLEQAIELAGRKFDNSGPGNLDPFTIQAAGWNVGTTVYLGSGTDCGVVSDNIYFVLDSSGGNTVKKAIQVAGGKIVAVKDFNYVSNTPPVAGTIAAKTYTVGTAASFQHVEGIFSDPGDVVTITSDFPAGFSYNASTRTVTMASNVAVGSYSLKLIGTDTAGQQAVLSFTVNVVPVANPAPVAGTIPNQTMTSAAEQPFQHADGVFSDPGDTLTITAPNLPAGFSYNASTRIITKAANVANGTYTIQLVGTDTANQTAIISFTITVAVPVVNPAPVAGSIPNQTMTSSALRTFQHADGVFSDPGDTITITAPNLPAGFSYNAATRTITKAANVANGAYIIELIGTDSVGQTASLNFTITVAVPSAQTNIDSVIIYRRSQNLFDVLYKTSRTDLTQLMGSWATSDNPSGDYQTFGYGQNGAGSEPGTAGYQFIDGLNLISNLAVLSTPQTYRIKLPGATDPFLSFQFTAANLQIGAVKIIYPV